MGPRQTKAEVAVSRLDRDLRDVRPGLDAGAVHVQLLLIETIGPAAGRLLHELSAEDVPVEGVRPFPVGDCDHAMVELHHGYGILPEATLT
jgi:hypothetical protein